MALSESRKGVSWKYTLSADSGKIHEAIPGVSISYPGVPVSAGMYVDGEISGDAPALNIYLALDIYSDITALLPVTVVKGSFKFDNFC